MTMRPHAKSEITVSVWEKPLSSKQNKEVDDLEWLFDNKKTHMILDQTGSSGVIDLTPVRWDTSSSTWIPAQADSYANAQVAGVAINVTGTTTKTFDLVGMGLIEGLTGLSAGSIYYLDPDTAGGTVTTKPVDPDIPVMIGRALSTTQFLVQIEGTLDITIRPTLEWWL